VAYHGCQTDLDRFLNIKEPLICAAGDNSSCVDISRDDIPDQEFTRAEACFCDKDLCNNDTPDFPDPVSTTKLPSKTCYDCGYKCINMTGDSCTPVPIDGLDTLRFCKDKATMSSYTKQCEGGDDCCGSLREYFEIIDPKTNEKRVDMIAYHGCEKDLAPALQANFSVICDSHTNSCYNASEGNPDDFMVFAKACFCDGDRCNSDLPSLPDPVPGGASSHQLLTVSIFCLILIVILF